jgi:dCMP deaminase
MAHLLKMKNKDLFYIKIAQTVSEASYCQRKKVGAIIVKNNNIIAIGYNGTISGFDNICELDNGKTRPDVLHAESNAIAKCAKSENNSNGATMYITLSPCFECSKIIIQSGIIEVVYLEQWKNTSGIDLLNKAGIIVKMIEK